eukprot:1452733-Pyramimonas_sp.AAC.1
MGCSCSQAPHSVSGYQPAARLYSERALTTLSYIMQLTCVPWVLEQRQRFLVARLLRFPSSMLATAGIFWLWKQGTPRFTSAHVEGAAALIKQP